MVDKAGGRRADREPGTGYEIIITAVQGATLFGAQKLAPTFEN